MKILFCTRPDAMTLRGGDTVQLLETKAALEAAGHTVTVSLDLAPAVAGFDVVHVFNLQTPKSSLPQVRAAKRHGCPVVLSTIYWDMKPARRAADSLRHAADARVASLARVSMPLAAASRAAWERLSSHRGGMAEMLRLADHLLPNSVAELEILASEFDCPELRARATIVPNAVKAPTAGSPPSAATEALLAPLPARFVLEVARVEAVKGQLALIRARDRFAPELPLVFAGQAPPSPYAEVFLRQVQPPRTFFLGPLPHDQLPALYRRAPVHALPSLRESPGLATLEAALGGCRCVVGIHAPVQEYFGDHLGEDVWCCDPEDEASIGRALVGAWQAPPSDGLARRIARDFTWQRAAAATALGYDRALLSVTPRKP